MNIRQNKDINFLNFISSAELKTNFAVFNFDLGKELEIATKGKRYAVIVDEAHSSQSGEAASELKKILNKEGIEAVVAEQILNLEDEALSEDAKEEMIRESLKVFLEKKLREIKTEMYEIRVKYKVSSVEEFEELYRRGQIEEKDTWQELQRLDHLEFKKDEIEGILRSL